MAKVKVTEVLRHTVHQKNLVADRIARSYNSPHVPCTNFHYNTNGQMKKEKKYKLGVMEKIFITIIVKRATKYLNMKGSWKTTLYAILTALGILSTQLMALIDGNPDTVFSVEVFIGAIVAALGVFGLGSAARDKDVSSEQERAAHNK